MTNLFIPPTGAMQFELLFSKLGKTEDIGKVFWVMPSPAERWDKGACSCKPAFRILLLDGDYAKSEGGKVISLCACNGRIIE